MSVTIKAAWGIHRTSKQSLVQYINAANSINLKVDELIFSTPEPVEGTWRESATDKNTIIRITAKEESKYRDTTLIVYDRLQLTHLNDLVEMEIKAYQPTTTHDLLKPIFIRFGIIIDKDDIIDEALVRSDDGDSTVDPFYTVKAKDTAIGWLGEFTVQVGEGNAILADYLNEPLLPGLNYPVEGDGFNGSALVYMYGLDFTDQKDVLDTYPQGMVLDEFSTDLLDAIKAVDVGDGKDLWNLDAENTEWSLYGAEVVYVGINDVSLPTNTSYKYVLGIKLRDDVTTPPGVMYLHYNDPLDPTEV